MIIDFSKIEELKSVRENKYELSKKEEELSKPVLDLKYMKTVYEIFSKISKNTNENRVIKRKKFIFISMYLFSPVSLVNGKTQKGVRESISSVLKMRSKSAVSNNLNDVVFQYKTYPCFRNDIDNLFSSIIEELKLKGIVN